MRYITSPGKRVFLKATDDSSSERAVKDKDSVFTRSWNSSALAYDYVKIGSVSSHEGNFEHGAMNDDFGTVSVKDPFSVSSKIAIALDDGNTEEAVFAGNNMQLWSKHMLLDADAAGSLEDDA